MPEEPWQGAGASLATVLGDGAMLGNLVEAVGAVPQPGQQRVCAHVCVCTSVCVCTCTTVHAAVLVPAIAALGLSSVPVAGATAGLGGAI